MSIIIIVLYPNFFKNVKYSNFNMDQPNDETHLSDGVYEQIKEFYPRCLTEEQESLVDKLILDKELKNNYKKYGLCETCKQPKVEYYWCQCQTKFFQQNFQ